MCLDDRPAALLCRQATPIELGGPSLGGDARPYALDGADRFERLAPDDEAGLSIVSFGRCGFPGAHLGSLTRIVYPVRSVGRDQELGGKRVGDAGCERLLRLQARRN